MCWFSAEHADHVEQAKVGQRLGVWDGDTAINRGPERQFRSQGREVGVRSAEPPRHSLSHMGTRAIPRLDDRLDDRLDF